MINLDDIETANREALLEAWLELFESDPPKSLSPSLMKRIVAHELQVKVHGGLYKECVSSLKNWQGTNSKSALQTKAKNSRKLKAGSRLMREWNGTTHIVEVSDTGFLWQGKTYRSLSAIAKAITGAHWSGPRFFGTIADQGGAHG